MNKTRFTETLSAVGLTLAALALAAPANATLVYSNDFDSAAFVLAGVTASGPSDGVLGTATGGPYNGSNGKSWNGNYFYNQSAGNPATASNLTLTNLPSHTGVSIDMLLGFLNSWDSTNGSPSPDYLDVIVDGTQILQMTTTTASGNVVNFQGGTQLVDNGQIDGSVFFSDDLVDMATASALSLSHSASTLTLSIRASGAGWQGGVDEFWGMDAVSITLRGTNNVPEPATLGLLSVGLAGLGAIRRKKRSA